MSESLGELECAIKKVLEDDEFIDWVSQPNKSRELKKAHIEWVCAIIVVSVFVAAFVTISIYEGNLTTGGAIIIGALFSILCLTVSGRDWYKRVRVRRAASMVYVITTKRALICRKSHTRHSKEFYIRMQRFFSPSKRVNFTVWSDSDGEGDVEFNTPDDLDYKGGQKIPNRFDSVDRVVEAEKLLRRLFPDAGVFVFKKENR